VYVHKDNPIKGLSIQQVDAIMSATRKCGGSADITKWAQVGITGELSDRTIAIYGRNSVSGTYGYFKSKALCKGDFRTSVAEQPGSASVVQSVSSQITAIGYSGIGYMTSGVRAVPVDCVCEQSSQSCLGSHHPGVFPHGVEPTGARDRGQGRLCAFARQDGCQSAG
jgi:ABC-type phosphate transport system substrate-binding protein